MTFAKTYFLIDDVNTASHDEEAPAHPVPAIYDISDARDQVPDGFNAVCIQLNGRLDADLNWKPARLKAVKHMAQGHRLLWEIDLGLFDRLPHPLSNQEQYLSLRLALEHFRDTLWKEFKQHTIGLCLYRGSLDFSAQLPWSADQTQNLQGWLADCFGNIETLAKETEISVSAFNKIDPQTLRKTAAGHRLLHLFCHDAAMEYLNLLAGLLPDGLEGIVLLDCASIQDPLLTAQLLSKERFDRLQRAVANSSLAAQAIMPASTKGGFIGSALPPMHQHNAASIGICLPAAKPRGTSDEFELKQALSTFHNQQIPFRIISEECLTTEWEGLDYLVVATSSLSPQGIRKLRGFCAAGGSVVCLGSPLGLPQEIPFKDLNI